MNRGDDTKRYLDMGYNVVSIEANPVWAKKVGELLKDYIESKRLTIKNMAISDNFNQSITFYVPKYKRGVLSMVRWLDSAGFLKSKNEGSKLFNESAGLITWLDSAGFLKSKNEGSKLFN